MLAVDFARQMDTLQAELVIAKRLETSDDMDEWLDGRRRREHAEREIAALRASVDR